MTTQKDRLYIVEQRRNAGVDWTPLQVWCDTLGSFVIPAFTESEDAGDWAQSIRNDDPRADLHVATYKRFMIRRLP